jgi:hypothetical protein
VDAWWRGLYNRYEYHQGVLWEMEIELCPHSEVGEQSAQTIVLDYILKHQRIPVLLKCAPVPFALFELRSRKSGHCPAECRSARIGINPRRVMSGNGGFLSFCRSRSPEYQREGKNSNSRQRCMRDQHSIKNPDYGE